MTHTIAREKVLADTGFQTQYAIETDAIERGIKRYRQMAQDTIDRGEGASVKAGERLVAHWLPSVSAAIAMEQRKFRAMVASYKKAGFASPPAEENSAGRAVSGPMLCDIKADKAACITISVALSACMKYPEGVRFRKLAHDIGRGILAELHLAAMRKHDKEARKVKRKRIAHERESGIKADYTVKRPNERELLAELTMRFRNASPRRINWWARKTLENPRDETDALVHVGSRLIWCLIGSASACGYDQDFALAFQHTRVPCGKLVIGHVSLTAKVIELIHDAHSVRELLRPKYPFMVIPPVTGEYNRPSGYLLIPAPLVSKPTPEQKAALSKADLTLLFRGKAALESTPLRVATHMREVIEHFWAEGGGMLKIPHAENRPEIPRPAGYNPSAPKNERWAAVDPEAKRRYKREANDIIAENIQRAGLREAFLQKLSEAYAMEQHPKVYLPRFFDFRFRMYPYNPDLNHQGDDVSRALLEFGDGKRPGRDGVRWLYIHAANCWGRGVDKLTFSGRIKWVEEHTQEIERSVSHWQTEEFWRGAKNPFRFLAACFALCDPDGIGAHIPVQQDRSCCGLQHYAALGRDPQGAAATNMLEADPETTPASTYGLVSDVVRTKLIAANQSMIGDVDLLPFVNGETCKPNVMTKLYGVTLDTARGQMMNALTKKMFPVEHRYQAAKTLAKLTLESVGDVCVSASKIMDWMQRRARQIALTTKERQGQLVQWTGPLGVPVIQPYRNRSPSRIVTCMNTVEVWHDDEKGAIDVDKHVNAIAANFVHNLDGSNMLLDALECRRRGVALLDIHDADLSHAATSTECGAIAREMFVQMHDEPLLEKLDEEWRTRYGLDNDPPPERSTLDIRQVLRAPYFMS